MSLLVDVQEVPWRTLEEVMARILANRERMKRRQQAEKVRGLTRPRPQERGLGATMSTYKRPEPNPIVLGDDGATGLVWMIFPAFQGGFNGTWAWSQATGDGAPIIKEDDTFTIKVGSGDGSKWITATMNLPGVQAWRDVRTGAFSPVATDRAGFLYLSDPTGKFVVGDAGSRTADDTQLGAFALPCGNGSAIVIVHVRASASYGGYASRCIRATFEDVGGLAGWRVNEIAIETLKNHNISVSDTAAFVVSATDCRELTVPAALQSVINTLMGDTDWSGPGEWDDGLVDGDTFFNTPAATNEWWYTDAGLPYRMALDALRYPLVTQYGAEDTLMQYDDPGYMFDALTFSPAIYTVFNRYADLFPTLPFADGINPDFNYSAGRATLRSLGSPAPAHVVGFDAREGGFRAFNSARDNAIPGYDGGWEFATRNLYRDVNGYLSGISVVRSNVQPETFYDQLPAAGAWSKVRTLPLAADRPTVEATAEDGYALLWHYDWGQPAYCRQQLQALGFTTADLTP